MDIELPLWAQSSATIILTLGAAVTMRLGAQRKAKKDNSNSQPEGQAQIVAATFMERQLVVDLSTSLRSLDGSIRELTPILARNNELLHDHALIERLSGRKRD